MQALADCLAACRAGKSLSMQTLQTGTFAQLNNNVISVPRDADENFT
jgi:hypothetical protein